MSAPLPENWAAFEVQCRARVADIEKHKDEGLYAQAYARDVGKLVRMLACLAHRDQREGHGLDLVDLAYDETP